MADKPALVDALPVLGKKLPICTLFHRGVVLLPADKAFHKSRLLIYQFCGVLVLGHHPFVSGVGAEIGVDCSHPYIFGSL